MLWCIRSGGVGAAALALGMLSACGGGSGAADADADAAVSLPNPAAVHCESQGGRITIESTAAGQAGICHLPDGTRIDEWVLYRQDYPESAEIDRP